MKRMRNAIYSGILVIVFCLFACTNNKTEGGKTGNPDELMQYLNKEMYVNSVKGIPLKVKPLSEASRIGFLRNGTSVFVIEILKKDETNASDTKRWLKVKQGELSGWINSDILVESAEKCASPVFTRQDIKGLWIKEGKLSKYFDAVNIHWLNNYFAPGTGYEFKDDGILNVGDFGTGYYQSVQYEVNGKNIGCFSTNKETSERTDLFTFEILCLNDFFITIKNGSNEESWLKWNSPLQTAAFGGETQKIEALLDNGVDINEKLSCGMTALMWAILGNREETVQMLLDKDAMLNLQDNFGRTALHFAVYQAVYDTSKNSMVKLLLDKNADFELMDYYWQTARDICGLNIPGFRTVIAVNGYSPQGKLKADTEALLGLFE